MAFTAVLTPGDNKEDSVSERREVGEPTSKFVHSEVNSSVAARTKFLLEEVVVFDVALARLDEPGAVKTHIVGVAALSCDVVCRFNHCQALLLDKQAK